MSELSFNKEFVFKHWIESSDEDFKTMINLYSSKDYSWSLFVGHLVIEKILKALYVNLLGKHPPYTHDLLRLAKKAGLDLSKEYEEMLDRITSFNINTRYEDYKKEFRKLCTKQFTGKWIDNIMELRKWLTNLL